MYFQRSMRSYVVAPVQFADTKHMVSIFVGAFGGGWLFIEPLGAFGLLPQFPGYTGLWLYGALIALGVIAVIRYVRAYQWYRRTVRLPFVHLVVSSTSDGVDYDIRAAANMQVGAFLQSFMDLLEKGPARERVRAFRHRYQPILQVRKDGGFVDVDSNLRVEAAGLKEGDKCQIRGEPHPQFNVPMFRFVSSNEPESE